MSRALVLGNGNIFVGLDASGYVREFYFPFVGLENHISAHNKHRIGVWVDGVFSWLDHSDWSSTVDCLDDTMAGVTTKENKKLGIRLRFSDVVYNEKNIFIRQATVHNNHEHEREVRIFFGQEFELYESHRGDTAYYDPHNHTVVHYKGRRVFLINLRHKGSPPSQYTTGIFNIYGKEGSFRDAEDGVLQGNPIEHGPCDSVLGATLTLPGHAETTVDYWLCAGESIEEVKKLNEYVLKRGADHIIESTSDYWRAWVNRYEYNFYGLSDLHSKLFRKSLFYIRAHADKRGAIIASGDTSMLQDGKDTYSYMWPRDAAFAALSLDATGDRGASRRFFEFCNDVITPEGYFMHKYLPDQSLGSSWHPWLKDGKVILPIQEDETAIILFALRKHYELSKDLEFIEGLYNSLIKRAAVFLMHFNDHTTKLPKPSYDLWEEKYGIHTFTAASVYGALNAAAYFAEILGKEEDTKEFTDAAEEIKEAILEHLYVPEENIFRKSVSIQPNGRMSHDDTVDASSAYGIFMFGVLEPTDERLKKAVAKTESILKLKTQIGGMARYVGDAYFRKQSDIIGNPWLITTLWYAQYHAVAAASEEETKKALSWTIEHASASGILSEQLDPHTGERISSTPLTWSHVEYVRTVLRYLEAIERLGICETCSPTKE